jgi:hypothetical protein
LLLGSIHRRAARKGCGCREQSEIACHPPTMKFDVSRSHGPYFHAPRVLRPGSLSYGPTQVKGNARARERPLDRACQCLISSA